MSDRTSRWALAEDGDGWWHAAPVHPAARPGARMRVRDPAEAVRAAPPGTRWVWRSTAAVYPRLLAAGARVERCHDIEDAELLLLGHEGRSGEPRSAAAAWARLNNAPVPPDPPQRAVDPRAQDSLFDPRPTAPVPLDALLAVHADQEKRLDATAHPDRMRLLTAAESAAFLVAAEMNRAGLPWRADVHRALLTELLGERYAGGGEPRRLAELADRVSAAFGRRVRPDLPADVVKAFAEAGFKLKSTRRWEIQELDHPAVEPLIEYKKLYRIYTAHGWSWLADWVHDGRFRPEFIPGGTLTGRWVTNGGGALQIPKVIRRAVVADPGWRLVVADADQMEPRVLAAISRDPAFMEVAGRPEDLYTAVSRQGFSGDRDKAKLAVLGAVYGQTSGDGLKNLAALRRRFPRAVAYVDDAAKAGEEGRLVRTWLGRTCPPPAGSGDGYETGDGGVDPAEGAGEGETGLPRDRDRDKDRDRDDAWTPSYASTNTRARGRFTRNFVVQGSAADWALLLLAALRQATAGMRAELVFFQHDEVIVHCPAEEAGAVVEAIRAAGDRAGRIAFGDTPVRFPFTTAVVECYADAK
ncbi:bifunctional 3'-5' exonuclease/DNA polymerase [Streptomyces sp. NPDC059979]|uniref:bifunctional 3'-5' exonuclease/DNA polymerase n=1 Tax=Streptomyces sp. NPDC059979 TaxID=3347021 RepID=UPI0036A9C6DF